VRPVGVQTPYYHQGDRVFTGNVETRKNEMKQYEVVKKGGKNNPGL